MEMESSCLGRFFSRPAIRRLFRRRKLEAPENSGDDFTKTLGALSLMGIGLGSVVGAGIFVLTGQAAAKYAGPSLALSFVISAIACFFTGLCYAELASSIPLVGGAYTYVYITSGEFPAWIVGLCLTLEYMFGASAVAIGWSKALNDLFEEMGFTLPDAISKTPVRVDDAGNWVATGGIVNLPAIFVLASLCAILFVGVRQSTMVNNVIVCLKVGLLVVFVGYGIYFSQAEPETMKANLNPFVPPHGGEFGKYGATGIFRGAGAIFFAYVGFDCVCAAAQECKNPQRDVPLGLFGTLVTVTVLFVAVTVVLTGLTNYKLLDVEDPVIFALKHVNAPRGIVVLTEIAALAGLTSVMLVTLLSQTRVMYAIAKDGLLPPFLTRINHEHHTPTMTTLVSGICCVVLAASLPMTFLAEIISFGTLIAFALVCFGVIRFRKLYPDIERPFSTPFVPAVPLLGMLTCFLQLFSLAPNTFRNCAVWLFLGSLGYVFYGRHNSHLAGFDTESDAEVPMVESNDPNNVSTPVGNLKVAADTDPRF